MAKKKGPSIHSRAARRATSPGIDTDKSLKDVQPPKRNTARPSVLSIHQSAGVSKKTRHGRNLSTKARRRQEKSAEMAEAVMERTSRKVERSKGRGRNIQDRSKAWDAINKAAEAEAAAVLAAEDKGDDDDDKTGDKAWETDDDMDGVEDAPAEGQQSADPAVAAAAPAPTDDDNDVIL